MAATEERRVINGVDVSAMEGVVGAIGVQPEAARAPKSCRVRWVTAFLFKALARNHTFTVDEPTHMAGEDTSPTSTEYVLGAYGTCLVTGFVFNATRRGITIRNLEVALQSAHNNYLTFLRLSTDGHPGLREITPKLYVQADADEATIREIWEHTVKASPVGNSLARSVMINPEVDVLPSQARRASGGLLL